MFEREDETVERVIQHLRRPVAIDAALDGRVMREIAQASPPRRRVWPRWSAAAAAAAALGAVLIARPWARNATSRVDTLQFVLVAPQAASVSLVGDFNGRVRNTELCGYGRRERIMMLAALLLVTQVAVQDPRLERLDPDTRSAVAAVADSANGVGLPAEPIIQRALEGATKGASGARIVAAVRRLALDLGTARSALGTSASAPELEAAVAALRAGATPQVLAHLRDVRRPPLTMALSVLADLVAGGVPVDSAAAAVLALAPKARDADLVEFRRAVERDIALGAPPGAATSVRLNAGGLDVSSGSPGYSGNPARPRRP